ncbi:hypothetical protein Vadar_030194 [Vaccinium darrowii]|uniref:Uncharacterized protein n=1 Tax=Vaccinium darrowii TaxID=229202 RepID=A0ACB7XUR5_9ERIC|nr:hypothetical protein Vadar_030194 [Vaccinium darrowii]
MKEAKCAMLDDKDSLVDEKTIWSFVVLGLVVLGSCITPINEALVNAIAELKRAIVDRDPFIFIKRLEAESLIEQRINQQEKYKKALDAIDRPISLSSQFGAESSILDNTHDHNPRPKKPLHVDFKEAVGLSGKIEHLYVEKEVETSELKRKLRKLEDEVRKLKEDSKKLIKKSSNDDGLKENSEETATLNKQTKKFSNDDGLKEVRSISKSLYLLFKNNVGGGEENEGTKNLGMEDPKVYKQLSPEMVVFVTHLYEKGYFSFANFMPRNRFDVTYFENSYGRNFIKFASENFGKGNQEIAKWLSASDLKKVALFGCPSLGKKNVFSAKRLRYFFRIQEGTVCSKCVLKRSCKFANQTVWRGDNKNLDLAVVMRVITLYALESLPPQLVVPDEIKDSVNRLLKEVVNLSQTVA